MPTVTASSLFIPDIRCSTSYGCHARVDVYSGDQDSNTDQKWGKEAERADSSAHVARNNMLARLDCSEGEVR